jgi:hypothetical protein
MQRTPSRIFAAVVACHVCHACLAACASDPNTGFAPATDPVHTAVDAGAALDATAITTPIVTDAASPEPDAPQVVTLPPASSCPRGADADGDGFTTEQGDCNDCDRLINPGAYDFPGNAFDEDCSGKPADDAEQACDMGLDIAGSAPEDAARALGLCKFTKESSREWGVIRARFTTADGSGQLDDALQVGLLPKFGAVLPRAGASLLALSSGVARAPDQPGYTRAVSDTHAGRAQKPPPGFPKTSSSCPEVKFGTSTRVYNQAALELQLRVPTNAYSLGFDSIFYSYEYPDFICLPYNDFYIALLEPHDSGDGNLVFDANGDAIGVNTGWLAVCDPTLQNPNLKKQFTCEQGTDLLKGTGFGAGEYTDVGTFFRGDGEGGASTGWLGTLAPVKAGSVITLRFAIWDTEDSFLDSTVLIDRFRWSVMQPSNPVTKPSPELL